MTTPSPSPGKINPWSTISSFGFSNSQRLSMDISCLQSPYFYADEEDDEMNDSATAVGLSAIDLLNTDNPTGSPEAVRPAAAAAAFVPSKSSPWKLPLPASPVVKSIHGGLNGPSSADNKEQLTSPSPVGPPTKRRKLDSSMDSSKSPVQRHVILSLIDPFGFMANKTPSQPFAITTTGKPVVRLELEPGTHMLEGPGESEPLGRPVAAGTAPFLECTVLTKRDASLIALPPKSHESLTLESKGATTPAPKTGEVTSENSAPSGTSTSKPLLESTGWAGCFPGGDFEDQKTKWQCPACTDFHENNLTKCFCGAPRPGHEGEVSASSGNGVASFLSIGPGGFHLGRGVSFGGVTSPSAIGGGFKFGVLPAVSFDAGEGFNFGSNSSATASARRGRKAEQAEDDVETVASNGSRRSVGSTSSKRKRSHGSKASKSKDEESTPPLGLMTRASAKRAGLPPRPTTRASAAKELRTHNNL